MTGIPNYGGKSLLDWAFLGATPTRPSVVGLHLCTAAPTTAAINECATATVAPLTVAFSAAGTAGGGGTVQNSASVSYSFTSAATISGCAVTDATTAGGNMLAFGNLATARTMAVGDSLIFAVNGLTITLT